MDQHVNSDDYIGVESGGSEDVGTSISPTHTQSWWSPVREEAKAARESD
jgi:hypothetical protein